jgi:tight adherence protein C
MEFHAGIWAFSDSANGKTYFDFLLSASFFGDLLGVSPFKGQRSGSMTPALLKALQEIRLQIQLGRSVSSSVDYCAQNAKDPYLKALNMWRIRAEAGQEQTKIQGLLPILVKTPARRAFLSIILKGLKGAPIDEFLKELEQEFFHLAETTYSKHLQLLPLKLLMPLALFIMPAILILLIGPLLNMLAHNF